MYSGLQCRRGGCVSGCKDCTKPSRGTGVEESWEQVILNRYSNNISMYSDIGTFQTNHYLSSQFIKTEGCNP